MIPVITTIGLQVGTLLAGAILTETIFSWPGIGKWMVDSIFRRDYPSVQGGLLLIADHGHAGQSDRRFALWHHQSSHQACPMTVETLARIAIDRRRGGRLALFLEFWSYFRENHGAVAGLIVFAIICLLGDFRRSHCSLRADRAVSRCASCSRLCGRKAAARAFFSARMRLAAICCPGSSTVLATPCSSAASWFRISLVVGILVGLFAGFIGGAVDTLIMRLMDIILAFPSLLLALALVAILGPSLTNAMIAIALVQQPHYVRLDPRFRV